MSSNCDPVDLCPDPVDLCPDPVDRCRGPVTFIPESYRTELDEVRLQLEAVSSDPSPTGPYPYPYIPNCVRSDHNASSTRPRSGSVRVTANTFWVGVRWSAARESRRRPHRAFDEAMAMLFQPRTVLTERSEVCTADTVTGGFGRRLESIGAAPDWPRMPEVGGRVHLGGNRCRSIGE